MGASAAAVALLSSRSPNRLETNGFVIPMLSEVEWEGYELRWHSTNGQAEPRSLALLGMTKMGSLGMLAGLGSKLTYM